MQYLREVAHGQEIIRQVSLTPPNLEMLVHNLSGGNQQKVAVGKWFAGTPRVMMFDEATQGIDVRAKQDIYRLARELTKTAAVLYASSDIDEVLGIADRVLVMHAGSIVATLAGDALDRATVLAYATGSDDVSSSPAAVL
jgi:ABC-type sugar transport system ATPase subunit